MLAATNRADALDVALMRPGRFDVQLHVPLPDTASRQAILEIHTRIMPLDPSVNLQVRYMVCFTMQSHSGDAYSTADRFMHGLSIGRSTLWGLQCLAG